MNRHSRNTAAEWVKPTKMVVTDQFAKQTAPRSSGRYGA
jgi:hypothetical protein